MAKALGRHRAMGTHRHIQVNRLDNKGRQRIMYGRLLARIKIAKLSTSPISPSPKFFTKAHQSYSKAAGEPTVSLRTLYTGSQATIEINYEILAFGYAWLVHCTVLFYKRLLLIT